MGTVLAILLRAAKPFGFLGSRKKANGYLLGSRLARTVPLLLVACSAPATPRSLARAEAFAERGDDAHALSAYEDATADCAHVRAGMWRARWCGAALRGRAEMLERLGRPADAADAWEIVGHFDASPTDAADGYAEAGTAFLKLGRVERAYDDLWAAIITYPDEAGAERALRTIVRDGRRRDAAALYRGLQIVAVRLRDSELADDTLYAMADLAVHELADPPAAIDLYDRIAADYPHSTLRDDALYHGAEIARAEHDFVGALKRYRALLASRETAYFIGSYTSEWMDDAQLAVGLIVRDNLGEPARALPEFRRVAANYPTSTLLDDALYQIAVTYDALHDAPHACATLATLAKKFPESRYQNEDAPALATRPGCGK